MNIKIVDTKENTVETKGDMLLVTLDDESKSLLKRVADLLEAAQQGVKRTAPTECKKCGAGIVGEWKICPNCGTRRRLR